MATLEATAKTPGALANNYTVVMMLQTTLSRTDMNLTTLPKAIRRVLAEDCWREWVTPEGKIFAWNAADFRTFLTSPRPAGCQTPLDVIERAIRGSDAWELYLEAIRGEPGAPEGHPVYSGRDESGQFTSTINRDIVTVNGAPTEDPPATIPLPVEVPRPRDYAREAPTGNSVSYAVRRLGVHRPDLLERVQAGEISAYRGLVLAGFKKAQITLPLDPVAAARLLRKHFRGDDLAALVRLLGVEDG